MVAWQVHGESANTNRRTPVATESIIDRIRKLLAMTPENGASESEAVNALRLANILMTRHGLDHDDIGPDYKEPEPKIKNMANKQVKAYEEIIARAAATLYLCKCIRHVDRNKRYKYPKIMGYTFVGLEEHIDAAEMTMLWLLNQLDYFYKISIPTYVKQDPKAAAHYRFSFKEGCANRILERVRDMMEAPSKDLVEQTGSSALVIQDYWDKLRQDNERIAVQVYPNLTNGRIPMGGIGYHAGQAAGDKVQLRREVGAQEPATPLPPQQHKLTYGGR